MPRTHHTTDTRVADPQQSPCYRRFVNVKTAKRLEKLAAEIRAAPMHTKRILVGLSLGASSAALVDILGDMIQGQLRKRPSPTFDVVVVHVAGEEEEEEEEDDDDDGGGDAQLPPAAGGDAEAEATPSSSSSTRKLLARYAQRYPAFRFLRIPLATALDLDTIDWAALPLPPPPPLHDGPPPTTTTTSPSPPLPTTAASRLRALLARMPSPTSRADARRLLVRHVLLAAARREGCAALALGHSTTALAEVTLAETAKGRGFSLPWMVGDGPVVVRRFGGGGGGEKVVGSDAAAAAVGAESETTEAEAEGGEREGHHQAADANWRLSVHHPNRDVFRGELEQYVALTEPPLAALLAPAAPSSRGTAGTGAGPGAVVSHRDISIDEVMTRYFADVERNYPSIVANVTRTTAKLDRPEYKGDGEEEEERCCGLCGMGIDELGDERWKGEMGDDGQTDGARLCYGCERAMRA